jgi:hypothetical protein
MTTVAEQVDALKDLSLHDLRTHFEQVYGRPHPPYLRCDLLRKAVAYKIQEDAQGGPNAALRDRLEKLGAELRRDGKIKVRRVPGIKPGTTLLREWQGETHKVTVTKDGFYYRETCYRSLSVIARLITGTRWSGPTFFGVKGRA